jgi:hypothetical protein
LSIAAAHHHGDRVGRVSRQFPQTLDKFAAPEVEQAELKAMVASTRLISHSSDSVIFGTAKGAIQL